MSPVRLLRLRRSIGRERGALASSLLPAVGQPMARDARGARVGYEAWKGKKLLAV